MMGVNLNRIRAYRTLHDLLQEEVASFLGITKQSYHLKEKGKNDFTSEEVGMLAKKFGVEPGELFKDNRHPLC